MVMSPLREESKPLLSRNRWPTGKLLEVMGQGCDKVLDLLRHRIRGLQAGGNHVQADRRLALVVEGGAMRGVYTAGPLFALDCVGARSAFDAVYAVSSGANNAAYFLSGTGKRDVGSYYQTMNRPQFANPWRFWKIVDVDWAEREVWNGSRLFSENVIRGSKTKFCAALWNRQTGKCEMLDFQNSRFDIVTVIKAACAMPVLYNRSVQIGDNSYMDAGVVNPIPIIEAIKEGATDVLVLLTRSRDYVRVPPAFWKRLVFRAMQFDAHPSVFRSFDRSHIEYNRRRRICLGETRLPGGVSIATLVPRIGRQMITGTTIESRPLRDATLHAAEDMAAFLGENENILGNWI